MPASAHPLSGNQQLIWQMQRLLPGNPLYCEAIASRIVSEFDVHALRRTCQWLGDRHAALRTTFRIREGRPEQVVHDTQPVSFRVHDARDLADDDLRQHFDREVYRPFDLETGPLMRAHLFLRAPGDHRWLLSFHHIAADFFSLMLILQDIRSLYPAAVRDQECPAPPPVSYTDFVHWQKDLIEGPEGRRQWQYWEAVTAAPPPVLRLPADGPSPRATSYAGLTHQFCVPPDLTARAHRLAATASATMNVVLLTGFQALLHRWCEQARFGVRTLVSGRSDPRFAQVVGHFANAVPLYADFADNPTFITALERTRRSVLAAVEHQDFPLALMAERIHAAGRPTAGLSSDVMFRFQIPHRFRAELRGQRLPGPAETSRGNAPGTRIDLGGLTAELSNPIRSVSYHAIDLELVEAGGEIAGYLHYRPDMFQEASIAKLAADYLQLLADAAERPETPVAEFAVSRGRTTTAAATGNDTRSSPVHVTPAPHRAELSRPLTPTESRVVRIWRGVLGVDAVGLHDTFGSLGGDSLAAAQVAAMLGSESGRELPLGLLLESPTVAEFAAHLDRLTGA